MRAGEALGEANAPSPSTLHRGLAYCAAVIVLPVMVLELVTLVPSLASTATLVVAAGLAITVRAPARVTAMFAVHLLTLSAFLILALGQGAWGIPLAMRSDLIHAMQALVTVPLIAGMLGTHPRLSRRFLIDVARGVAVVGAGAALLGLAKLAFMTRGILVDSLFLADGRYPPGATLQQDYNQAALGLLIALCCALWLSSHATLGRWERLAFAAISPVLGAAILLSTSRRGLLFLLLLLSGLALAAMLRVFRRARGGRIRLRLLTVVVATLGVGVGLRERARVVDWAETFLAVGASTSRLQEVTDRGSLVSSRAPLTADAFNQLAGSYSVRDLMLGRGTTYLFEMGNAFNSGSGVEYPHNFVLSAMLHGGLLLTLLMLGLVSEGVLRAWRLRTSAWPLLATLVFASAFALSSSMSLYSHETLYLLLVSSATGGAWFAGHPPELPSRMTLVAADRREGE